MAVRTSLFVSEAERLSIVVVDDKGERRTHINATDMQATISKTPGTRYRT